MAGFDGTAVTDGTSWEHENMDRRGWHAASSEKSWFSITLDKEYWIQRVVFMGRTECCADRLRGIKAFVGDKPGIDQTHCGTSYTAVSNHKGGHAGHIGALGCRCLVLGKVVTIEPIGNPKSPHETFAPYIARIAVFGFASRL